MILIDGLILYCSQFKSLSLSYVRMHFLTSKSSSNLIITDRINSQSLRDKQPKPLVCQCIYERVKSNIKGERVCKEDLKPLRYHSSLTHQSNEDYEGSVRGYENTADQGYRQGSVPRGWRCYCACFMLSTEV